MDNISSQRPSPPCASFISHSSQSDRLGRLFNLPFCRLRTEAQGCVTPGPSLQWTFRTPCCCCHLLLTPWAWRAGLQEPPAPRSQPTGLSTQHRWVGPEAYPRDSTHLWKQELQSRPPIQAAPCSLSNLNAALSLSFLFKAPLPNL